MKLPPEARNIISLILLNIVNDFIVPSKTRLLALEEELLKLHERSTRRTRRLNKARRTAGIMDVVEKLFKELNVLQRLSRFYLSDCESPDSGDLRVLLGVLRDSRAVTALVGRVLGEIGDVERVACPIAVCDVDPCVMQAAVVPVEENGRSRRAKAFKKAVSRTGGIRGLPQEILDLICDHVTGCRDSKNLRLVAKSFADRAALNVFKTLVVYPHPDSYELLHRIPEVPRFANAVTTLAIPRMFHGYSPEAWCFADWKEEKRLRAAYDKLGYWTAGDQTMIRWLYSAMNQAYEFSGPRLPVLPFEKFPNLKNVESIGCDQLGPLVSDRTRDVSHASRVASDLLFLEDGRSNFQLLNLHWILLLLALHHARKSIMRLTFISVDEILGGFIIPLECLKNLESLTLDFSEASGCQTTGWGSIPGAMNLWSWMRSATSLKSLTLAQCVLRGSNKENLKSIDFFQVLYLNKVHLAATKFPALESLHLKYITTRDALLCNFLREHRETLTSLRIDQPQMRYRDWKSLREKILNGDGDGMVVRPDVETMISNNVYNPSVKSEERYRRMELVPR